MTVQLFPDSIELFVIIVLIFVPSPHSLTAMY